MADLEELAGRVEGLTGPDNGVDVLVEVALFEPDCAWKACRANFAGTKVIYTDRGGKQHTHWARDWTLDPGATAAALRSRTQGNQNG